MKGLCLFLALAVVSEAALPGNKIRVVYVDSLTDWWGGEKVAAGIAMPGYA